MAGTVETMQSLLAEVTQLTEKFTKTLKEKNLPEPTFAVDSPTSYSGLDMEMFQARQMILDKLTDLSYLVQGPSESIFNYAHTSIPDIATLNVLNHFDFWSAVPIGGSASYAEIAKHTKLPEEAVQRLLEHAATMRLFSPVKEKGEPTTRVEHNSRSAALAKSPGIRAQVSCLLNDAGPALLHLYDGLDKFAVGKEKLPVNMEDTSFNLLYSGGSLGNYKNSWELLENDGEGERKGWRQRRFVEFMVFLKDLFQMETVLDNAIDWKALGDATVVDIGGSGGHDAAVLAKKYPNLNIVVEDLHECEPAFNKNVPSELKSRLTFREHNFFDPQPIQADVYLLKLILHDWPEKESIQILQNIRPSLKPGSRIMFIDYVGKQETTSDGPALPRSIQAMGTSTDIRMMALFNAKERPVDAWKKLFKAADERFDVVRVEANPLTFIVVLEVVWRG